MNIMTLNYTLSEFKEFLDSLPDNYKIKYKSHGWEANFEYMRLFWLFLKMPKKRFNHVGEYLGIWGNVSSYIAKTDTMVRLHAIDTRTRFIMKFLSRKLVERCGHKQSCSAKDIKMVLCDSVKDNFCNLIQLDDNE